MVKVPYSKRTEASSVMVTARVCLCVPVCAGPHILYKDVWNAWPLQFSFQLRLWQQTGTFPNTESWNFIMSTDL